MAIIPKTPGLHHIGLRCLNMEVTKEFYQNTIGLPLVLDTPDLVIFATGSVYVAFKQADPRDGSNAVFSPYELGLDHVAMTCETEEELHRFAKGLNDAGVENTGVKTDAALNKLYVAFKDPDRIQWEFYMA
ncbi:MAG: VOC family protein [Chitinophagaceae bacterium]|nr:MAG: VOC family protein [Chitinophagaceae bacterium]